MSEQVKKLVPKLRFPDFEKDSDWHEDELGNLASFINEKITTNQLTISNYVSTENILPDFSGLVSASKLPTTESATCFRQNDILISNIRPYLKKVCLAHIDGGCSNDVIVIRANKRVNTLYLSYILRNDAFIDYVMNGAKGVKMPRGDISMIKEYPVPYPKPKEQQKIADCLSSLDDLITAQHQKVQALKQHKKGLMQQLFPEPPPAKGEYTEGGRGLVPKLRFPEFENDAEWVLEEFSKYIVLYRGSSPRPIQSYLTSDSNGVNWIKIGDTKNAKNSVLSQVEERITPEGAKHSRKVTIGELILANSMSYGKTYEVAIEGCIYDGWFVLREYENHFDKQFLLQLLNSEYMQSQYQKLSAGGIVQNISSDIVYKTILPCTSLNEQKKIADCLSSLDDLITTQTQQLEAYKTHKKGLMQQLFPSLDEVDA